MKVRNHLLAVLVHFAVALGALILAFPPARLLLKKLVFQPGEGPSKEDSAKDRFEYRGIGNPDFKVDTLPRAFVKLRSEGSIYRSKSFNLTFT